MTVFEGNTVDAAITAGLEEMHRTRDQVTIVVLQEAKKGFLGLGKQPARVQVTAVSTSATPTTSQAASAATTSAASQERPVVQAKVTVAQPTAKPATIKAATITTESAAPQVTVKSATKPVAAQPAKARKTAQPKKPAKTEAEEPAPVRTPEQIAARQAANEQAVRDLSAYLLEIVKELGITADLDVDFGNRYATLNFDTAKQGLLIGKHGRTINALQDLAQVYMNHHGASHVNVVLDVDDYRDRRAATLKRLAESTAREAIATGKQVFLDPMPSFERKLIHAELADNHHVTTFSEGRDPHRAVVVAIRK